MNKIRLIKAKGSNYDLGFTVGREAKDLIEKAINSYRRFLPREEGWSEKWLLPAGFPEAAIKHFPHLVEELQGMADGSKLDFSDLFFLNALEEALDLKPPSACTSIALSNHNRVLLGHNEDWYADDEETVVAIYGQPLGKPAFLSITAAPFLAAVGMNEAGIAQGVNSVTSTDCRIGVPRMFSARAVLEAGTIEEAIKLATPGERAGGYNHLLASASGKTGNLETTATESDFLAGKNITCHTNHYLSDKLSNLTVQGTDHSLTRYRRLIELGKAEIKAGEEWQALSGMLADHENRPLSICKHAAEQKSNEGTIFSVIFDLKLFKTWVAVGNPCGNIYSEIII